MKLPDRAAFGLCFALHFVLFALAFLLSFGASMSRFESGAEAGLVEQGLSATTAVLGFPLLLLVSRFDAALLPGLLGWLPFLANSALWAGAWVLVRRRRMRARGPRAGA